MWFRRDLRLRDNPALLAAAGQGDRAGGPRPSSRCSFVDPALWQPSGAVRRAYLRASLGARSARIGGDGLLLGHGDPVAEVVAVARAAEAEAGWVAADFGPYGRTRDERGAQAGAQGDLRPTLAWREFHADVLFHRPDSAREYLRAE